MSTTITELELTPIGAHALPRLPDDSGSTSAHSKDGSKATRKSIEVVEGGPASQSPEPPATAVPASTPASRRKARIQFAVLCWVCFLAGWNDGTTGPLLERIQAAYNVGFTIVSLIFISNCIGFVLGAAANVWLTDRLGFGKVMVIGALAQVVGYCLEAPAPPFPVLVLGYAITGFGLSLQDAGASAFVICMKENAATKMGILHAIYGVGGFSSPLVATQFAQQKLWSFHYLVSLGIAISNLALLIAVFRFKDQDSCLAESGQAPMHDATAVQSGGNKYKQLFKLRALHLLATFVLIYVGVEVTLGGWVVTYLKDVRGGGASAGYVSSGFFGGLTIGRVALLWVNKKVGERRAIFLYGLLAIGLELIFWLVPSLVGGAVAVSLVGVLLGPIYPIVMNHAARVLPPWLLTGAIGWIAGFGQAGSALLPFLTGALAGKAGIKALQPFIVSMMGFMMCLWAVVPNAPRRVD